MALTNTIRHFSTDEEASRFAHAFGLTEYQYLTCMVGNNLVFLCGSDKVFMPELKKACSETYKTAALPISPFISLCDTFANGRVEDLRSLQESNPELRKELSELVIGLNGSTEVLSPDDATTIYAEKVVKIYETATDCKIQVVD